MSFVWNFYLLVILSIAMVTYMVILHFNTSFYRISSCSSLHYVIHIPIFFDLTQDYVSLVPFFDTTETITSYDPASNNLLEVNKKTPNTDVVMVSS